MAAANDPTNFSANGLTSATSTAAGIYPVNVLANSVVGPSRKSWTRCQANCDSRAHVWECNRQRAFLLHFKNGAKLLPVNWRSLMQHRKWISALDIDRWADTTDARSRLPELVRRLVHATVEPSDLLHVDFNAGEETQRPDYDGTTNTARRNAWIPEGLCYWEMGVNARVKDKLDDDYQNRVERRGAGDFSQVSYRAITPRDYQNKGIWVDEKMRLGQWRDVRVYDSSDLEQWLENAPGVALWLARYASHAPPAGVLDLSTYWENLRASLRSPLPPEIFLISREGTMDLFRTWLDGQPMVQGLHGHSPQEVIDVFAAWVESLGAVEGAKIASRAIIVENLDAWRDLAGSEQRLILVAGVGLELDQNAVAQAQRSGHHVLLPVTTVQGQGGGVPRLARMNRAELEKRLIENGVSEQEAHSLARHSDGSFTLLRRQFSSLPLINTPEWGQDRNAGELAPLMLAGTWHDQNAQDLAAIGQLTKQSDADTRKLMTRWHRRPDAPVRWNAVGVWEFISPLDAWTFLGPALTRDHLDAFEDLARTILGEDDPRLDMEPGERWQAPIRHKTLKYSGEIRKGVTQTLALLATRPEADQITDVVSLQTRVERVVRFVLPADSSWRRWASLGALLPLLAEAAPEAVLEAIEGGLHSSEPELPKIFGQEHGGITGRAEHAGLLWALERLAWSPQFVTRISLALAKLGEHDPGGQWSNRPSGSLLKIFFSWMPHTVASFEVRLGILRLLLSKYPRAAWKLLLSLLPQSHESIILDHTPEWRFWAEDWQRHVSRTDYERTVREYTSLAVSAANDTPSRWPELIPRLPDLSEETAMQSLDALAQSVPRLRDDVDVGRKIWEALRELAQKHRYFTDAVWRWPEPLIARAEAVRDAFQPDDALELAVPWFEHGFAMIGDQSMSYEQQETLRGQRRAEVVVAVLERIGFRGVTELARRSADAWAVGISLAAAAGSGNDAHVLPALLCSSEQAVAKMAGAYAAVRIAREGTDWVKHLPLLSWEVEEAGALTAYMAFDPSTWDFVQSLGERIECIYWQRTGSYGRGLSTEAVARAVRQFLAVGRPSSALQLMVLTSNEAGSLPATTLLDLVEAALNASAQEAERRLDFYDIQTLLEKLQASPDVDETRLARLEWRLMPGLDRHSLLPTTLQKALACDPAFFIELLTLLYRPRHQQETEPPLSEPDEAKADLAKRAWRLLRDWERVPGTRDDGTVDTIALRAWLDETRKLARDIDRLEVAEVTIGEMFARAPGEPDGSWPCIAVRDALEACESSKLESGFTIGIANLRGAHFKSLAEGGKQERELAEKYESYAAKCRGQWPRTEAVLMWVVKDYLEQARRADAEAKRDDG